VRAIGPRCGVAVVIIAMLALSANAAVDAATVPFRTLARGADSKIATRHELVAGTAGTWHLLWYKHSGGNDPPAVDMAQETILAVFAGKQPTTNSSIAIVTVVREGDALVVHYRAQRGAASGVNTVSVTPFHIVAVRSRAELVRFIGDR
jgi:hypothetical protein